MVDEKKFLDQNGVEYLWSQLSLEDYPNNETLIAVLNAIDQTKADKDEIFSGSWNDLEDKPFGNIENATLLANATIPAGTTQAPFLTGPWPVGYYRIYFDNTQYPDVYHQYTNATSIASSDIYPCYFIKRQTGPNINTDVVWNVFVRDNSISHEVSVYKIEQELIKLDEQYIPDSIARTEYIDTQIATHAHSWNDLKDKPFYENVNLTLVNSSNGRPYPGQSSAALKNPLTKGEYSVNFNGAEYFISIEENTTLIQDENLPFIISKTGAEQIGFTWLIESVDKTTSYTYEINLIERDLKQLDKKFIPIEITNKVENCLTNEDIVIIDLPQGDVFTENWRNQVKDAVANGRYTFIKYNNIYYNVTVTEDNWCAGCAFISPTEISEFHCNLNESEVAQVISKTIVLEEKINKTSNWDNEKSGSTIDYPSINTMEEYVQNQLEVLDNYYNKTEVDAFHGTLEDYVDNQVAALVNAAPETLDTLGELATAFEENKEVVEALDASITNKQDKISDTLILVDTVTGLQHKIQIQNGQLVSFPVE